LSVAQAGGQIQAASNFERTQRLVIFMFDPNFRPEQSIQTWVMKERRRF
jgi:hypothetical protein